jgi:hypothetical protein
VQDYSNVSAQFQNVFVLRFNAEYYLAAVWFLQPAECTDEGGFPGSVWTQKANNLPRVNGQVQLIQNALRAVRFRDLPRL